MRHAFLYSDAFGTVYTKATMASAWFCVILPKKHLHSKQNYY
jgi:hypothetical protein